MQTNRQTDKQTDKHYSIHIMGLGLRPSPVKLSGLISVITNFIRCLFQKYLNTFPICCQGFARRMIPFGEPTFHNDLTPFPSSARATPVARRIIGCSYALSVNLAKITKHFCHLLLGLRPSLDPLRGSLVHNALNTYPIRCQGFARRLTPFGDPRPVPHLNKVYLITFYRRLKLD